MLNAERIAELLAEVGEDDFYEVVGLFCDEVEEVLDQLDAGPRDTLADQLHFLKGSAFNIGLDAVGTLCAAEEKRLKEDPSTKLDILGIRAAYRSAKSKLLN